MSDAEIKNMTDLQINAFMTHIDTPLNQRYNRITKYMVECALNGSGDFDYCSVPNLTMPLAFKNRVSVYPKDHYWHCRKIQEVSKTENCTNMKNIESMNINPLRAICEVILMIGDKPCS